MPQPNFSASGLTFSPSALASGWWASAKASTDYRISALPLGGYVKMAGENPLESHSGAPDEFVSHPRWQRFVIAAAGPAMNILLAVGLLTGVNMVHYEHPVYLDQPAVIGWVMENSPAEKAGIQAGDRIVRIDGMQNPTWEDVLLKSAIQGNKPLDLAVQRGDQILEKQIAPFGNGLGPRADSEHRVGAGRADCRDPDGSRRCRQPKRACISATRSWRSTARPCGRCSRSFVSCRRTAISRWKFPRCATARL